MTAVPLWLLLVQVIVLPVNSRVRSDRVRHSEAAISVQGANTADTCSEIEWNIANGGSLKNIPMKYFFLYWISLEINFMESKIFLCWLFLYRNFRVKNVLIMSFWRNFRQEKDYGFTEESGQRKVILAWHTRLSFLYLANVYVGPACADTGEIKQTNQQTKLPFSKRSNYFEFYCLLS